MLLFLENRIVGWLFLIQNRMLGQLLLMGCDYILIRATKDIINKNKKELPSHDFKM
jgi:hypothetical protein